MIARLSATDFATRSGWPNQPTGADGVLSAVAAEYLRSAIGNAYDGEPVSVQSILGMAEDRLGAIFSFQSALQVKLFGDDPNEDTSRTELKQVLDWLADIGDVVSVGHGWYYPAQTRLIELPSKDFAVLSGASSDELEREFKIPVRSGAFGRVVHAVPSVPLIQQTLRDWLKIPASLLGWTRQMLASPLTPVVTDAANWEVAHFAPRLSFGVPTAVDFGPVVVARVKRDGMPGYNRYLARLRKDGNTVATVATRELRFHDCTRLMHGIRLERGLRADAIKGYPCDLDHFLVATNMYQLPEVVTMLTYFAVHRSNADERENKFFVPKRHEDRLRGILGNFGVNLQISHG
jgi:hypothetical protein